MRTKINLNNGWHYTNKYEPGMEKLNTLVNYEEVNIPHGNIELPYHYFDEKLFQFVSCYQLTFYVGEEYKGKIPIIRFEGVMAYAKVYLNGVYMGDHKGGYTPFEFSLSEAIMYNNMNILTVVVDSREIESIPPFGGQIDYLTYGGIYREVTINFYDQVYIKNVKIDTFDIYKEEKGITLNLYIDNSTNKTIESDLEVEIFDDEDLSIYKRTAKIIIANGQEKYQASFSDITNVKLWDIYNPHLYRVSIHLCSEEFNDQYDVKIGFRECEFRTDGFYLNNIKLKLIGLNRHQSFPYNGYAMPKRVQERDAVILKDELHLNMVRTSHYPQSIHFIDKCDEIGLLVFEEMPGWQHIGNEEWKQTAIQNVKEMIERDWNHPSIVLWGVRINESQDDDTFYERTNQLARELDETRQTGGVRCIENSRLLEDVYTMNDFIHDGSDVILREQQAVTGLVKDVPYLVTEYNGHMYPTKKFDQEDRQMEHVLRHLKIQNQAYLMDNVSGAIGWSAFDYNTHKDFGSGDRICYHGIMDMFRIPKFASYVYKSQISPEIEPVLKPVTYWARGDRSVGGIIPLIILTNCDYVEIKYGEFSAKRIYPAKEMFSGLPYPPVYINTNDIDPKEIGEWGMKWEDCIIQGFYKEQMIAEIKLPCNPLPAKLIVKSDDLVLSSKEKDATRVVVEVVDQYGNTMPFIEDIINVDIKGVGKVIGPKNFVLTGGSRAFWVETQNIVGTINIHVKSVILGKKSIEIEVV